MYHFTFTTLPRNVLDVPGCSSNSYSSCAEAVKVPAAILMQERHIPLGQLAYGAGAVSDGGLGLSLGQTSHTFRQRKLSPRLVRVQATTVPLF